MKSLLKEIESKFKDLEEQDQDRDGDKDFADVMIARMMKSGMSREDAIKKVRDKQYNEQSGEGSISVTDPNKAKELADKGMDVKLIDEAFYSRNPIETLVSLFGYRQGIAEFLEDNPGAVDALIEWILSINDFREQIKNEFTKEEAEDMGIYDLDYDLDEMNTSAAVTPYSTPKAFGKLKDKDIEQLGYKKVQEAMDKKYEQLIESYKKYALGDAKMTPDKRVKETIKEVSKKLQEIEQLVRYSSRLKTESGLSRDGYGPAVNNALTKISERLVKISERVRALGE